MFKSSLWYIYYVVDTEIKEDALEQEPTTVSCVLTYRVRQTFIRHSHECVLSWVFVTKEIYSFNKHLRINLATSFCAGKVLSWEEDLSWQLLELVNIEHQWHHQRRFYSLFDNVVSYPFNIVEVMVSCRYLLLAICILYT